MPGLDKTGPVGLGAQTGRKQGQCENNTDTTMEITPRGNGRLGRRFRNRKNNNSEMLKGAGRGRGKGLKRGQGRGNS